MMSGETVASSRMAWLDAVKAIAITFVVLGHVLRGLNDAHLFSDSAKFLLADNGIYLFHMPVFFLISGLTFSGTTRTWPDLLNRSGKSILLPYFIWATVLILMQIALAGAANAKPEWYRIAQLPFRPYSIFWFLYVLFIMQIIVRLLLPLKHGAVFMVFVGAVTLTGRYTVPFDQCNSVYNLATFLLFFALGCVAKPLLKSASNRSGLALLAAVAFVMIEIGALAAGVAAETLAGRLIGLPLAVLFIAAFAFVGQWKGWLALSFIGANTIAIYCMHTMFTAATRIALAKVGITALPLHLVIGTFVGIICPLIAYLVAARLGLAPVLGFGSPKRAPLQN